ncbi:MAG: S1C family serine protease [Acidobacteriota bacterium]|nr:S1C family serine protease [Acidobacteriota bacterium]
MERTDNALDALSQQLAEAVERVSNSIVAVDARPRVRTSGVTWRPGVVVSTNHTIRRDEEITVASHDGRQTKATLVGRDPGTDLAVLRVEDSKGGNTPAPFADASALKVGNLVLAVGRIDPDRSVSAGLGIVGVLGEKWRTWRGGEIDRLIRPDISIFIGFSGGALVNTEGQVVGINTTGLARGAGLTIPASTVNRVVDQLLKHGHIARPYLGVGMHPVALPDKLRGKFNLPVATGLMMLSVEANAPADKAGITIGDILLALDDAPTTNTDDVQSILGGKEIGAIVKAKILRGGEVTEAKITLGERPIRSR